MCFRVIRNETCGQVSPQLWSSIHEVKDLCRVEQLFELAEELHALVITTLTVHQHQQRTGAGRTRGFPETCSDTEGGERPTKTR